MVGDFLCDVVDIKKNVFQSKYIGIPQMDYKFPGLFTLKRRSCACIFLGRKVCILCGRSTPFFIWGKKKQRKFVFTQESTRTHMTLLNLNRYIVECVRERNEDERQMIEVKSQQMDIYVPIIKFRDSKVFSKEYSYILSKMQPLKDYSNYS